MEYYEMTAETTAQKLDTDTRNGLAEDEAGRRLLKYGANRLRDKKKRSFISRFSAQLCDFMIIILLGAATVSFVTSQLAGDRDITEPLIILAIVLFNALLGTVQEIRAEQSLEALKKLSAPHATVRRNGMEYRVDSANIVPGDIIRLRSGDMVCADCRLVAANRLSVNESSLTGEPESVLKDADMLHKPLTPIGDIKNMLMSSTFITEGDAEAIVVRTGMDTEVGRIASMLTDTSPSDTPLQKRLAATGRALGMTALVICAAIFIIGTLKHIPPLEMFMTSVSLAVAAIPEGLPAIVTIMLALGVVRMSAHNAIVRKLPSVETLGCATVICTDKTGTLTENKMKVEEIRSKNDRLLLELSVLCSEDGEYTNPTDLAIIKAAETHNIDVKALRRKNPMIEFIPFNPTRKRMSIKCGDRIIIKGALEYILPLCTRLRTESGDTRLTAGHIKEIETDNNRMTGKALRVIACAYKNDTTKGHITESGLIFAGLIGIADPPRREAKAAVESCKNAGIRTIMITGDHARTALAVAKAVGIAAPDDTPVTGTELDMLTDEDLRVTVNTCNIYARVSPAHKSKIVSALKANGEVVAMTGDGINDAPALSAADIGCSMGISGTEVAKSASDMVLTDDNFATIVYAVREGRIIYDNIKKSVKFLLSSNIGEILTVMFGIIFGCAPPLTAIELLWVNLVTDSLPAIALGLDPPSDDIMTRKPTNVKKGMFSGALWLSIAFEGMMIGALALLAYELGLTMTRDETTAQTMAFFVLSISQLVHAFNMRSERSVIRNGLFKNKFLVLSLILGTAAQLAVINIPKISEVFNVCPLNTVCTLVCIGLSVLPLFIVELQKLLHP